MSVSPAEAVRHLQQRLSHRAGEDLSAEAAAKELLPGFVRVLKEAGAKRVVLFGSLSNGLFRRGSDIDLAVSGLTERSLAMLEYEFTLAANVPVELANLEAMPPSLKARIDRVGLELE